jgi:DNA/RNA-binding protein KIN17
MRDENGFKMHTQSESHVRQMLLVGEDPKKYINDYSNQFQRDFLQLLRTSHGEKKVHLNHFYQEYIANKEHVHMNSTKWPSLTEFAKFLGREGICRVEEDDKGIHVSWVDNSPENLRRREVLARRDRLEKGDEEREQKAIREQIRRAKVDAENKGEEGNEGGELKREEGEKVVLSFGAKSAPKVDASAKVDETKVDSGSTTPVIESAKEAEAAQPGSGHQKAEQVEASTAPPAKVSMKMGFQSKPKNVFAAAKKNALGGKKTAAVEQPKKMSEAERIMKEEMERKGKRAPPGFGGPPGKKMKF